MRRGQRMHLYVFTIIIIWLLLQSTSNLLLYNRRKASKLNVVREDHLTS